MKDHSFSFDTLNKFSNSEPYNFVPSHFNNLLEKLEEQEKKLRFPAIKRDVGSLISFLMGMYSPRRIFEMGSGYGHSAFWYFIGSSDSIEEVILTEKRDDLKSVFNSLPWPVNWKNRVNYYQGDAFETLSKVQGEFDFFLIDGVKADYLEFMKAGWSKLSRNGIVAIDNSYWRGSFLDKRIVEKKKSAQKVAELHRYIRDQKDISAIFVPFADGLTLLRKA